MLHARRLCRTLASLVFLISLLAAMDASAQQSGHLLDRPSANPVPLPEIKSPNDAPPQFALPPVPEHSPDLEASQQSIKLNRVEFKGNYALSGELLKENTRPYEGRKVSLDEIEELRQKLTRLYIDRGYINSGAIIQDNAYADGILTIHLVEGVLDEIQIRGTERLRPGYVSGRLWPDRSRPLNVHELEDGYQRLLSDPLIAKMDGQLLPGNESGHAVLDVNVTRARPYYLTLFGNNYRPPSIGAEAFGLTAGLRNLTGLGDTLDFTYLSSGGSDRYGGGWSVPLTDAGTEFFFRFDEGSSSVIEEPVKSLDIRSQIHTLEGGFSHPLFNSLNQRLTLGVSLGVRGNETSLAQESFSFVPGEESNRTQATVLRFFQDYFQRWENRALALRSTFSFGINAFGATPERDPNDPDSEFFAWLGQFQFAQRVSDNGTQLVLRGVAQFSDSPLLPLEQIAVGGVATVRGYRENYLVRDNGFALSLELRKPINVLSPLRVAVVPFFDVGSARNNGRSNQTDTLYALGMGLEAEYQIFHLDFYYGHAFANPLPTKRGDLQDDGIHFQGRIDVF